MGKLVLAAGLICGVGFGATAVLAQENTADKDVPGRYSVIDSKIGDEDASVLLDTAYGRTWVLVKDEDQGLIWKRVFFDSESENVPDGSGRRPPRLKN
ncbi:hypothetical protein HH303_13745 [Rhodospirillaceae bacterium KN72]|uniref:Uncharacterized protein n=1 Tax=Pacificispira spongiicola TaxID=2729598 RepID=A0A7Y0E1K0_9PROT|nr:hypothetical protein [Pacificispira spongiicola]NMM45553.1 hypothetical protein [Pacificispira spongiicola]